MTIYLIMAIVAVLCYCYALVEWSSVKPVGPNAFLGSPDWSHLYFSAYERYLWMSGLLFGLAVAGVPFFALVRMVSGSGRRNATVLVVAMAIPTLALVLGCAHESRRLPGEGERGGQRSSMWGEPTRVDSPPLANQLQV